LNHTRNSVIYVNKILIYRGLGGFFFEGALKGLLSEPAINGIRMIAGIFLVCFGIEGA
jgi:hypothetical protein